jgi:Secretion system C-terminal sorting domain
MKIKALLALSAVALVSFTSWFAIGGEKKIGTYMPREARPAGTYYESLPFMQKLKGNNETGQFEASDYREVAQAVEMHDRNHSGDRATNLSWWEMGPDNVGGRTRAILAVDNNIIFAGSVSGGLYKSTNSGNNWTRVESLDAIGKTMAISCIDQTGDGAIYVGTGSTFESNFDGSGGSAALGVGLYKSTDMGATWSLVPGTDPAAFNGSDDWALINDVAADPNVPSKLWIASKAGTGYWDASNNTLDMTTTGLSSSSQGHDIEWAADGSYCLVSLANGNIYKSENGGSSFSEVSQSSMNGSRACVAISPDDANICYALYTSGGNMGGLFYSDNKGVSWTEVFPSGLDDQFNVFGTGQGFYDLALTVKPGEPGVAWMAGVTLWKAGNSTQPEQLAYNFGFGGMQSYVHSDIHTFEIAPNGDWYIGCDGGVFKSVDGGATFIAVNRGYNVTQFYGIAHSGGFPVMGGTQDNGTQVLVGMNNGFQNLITDQQAFQIMGGDGFDCDMTQTTEGAFLLFGSLYYGGVERFDPSGTGGSFYDNEIAALGTPGNIPPDFGIFYTPLRLFEDTEDEDSQQYSWVLNPTTHTIADTTITVLSQNLNIPYQYYIPANDPLQFWPLIERPAFSSTELLTSDPDYPWLDAQEYTTSEDCDTTITQIGTDTISNIEPVNITVYWNDSVFFNDQWYYFTDSTLVTVDYDTTFTYEPINSVDIECTTMYNYIADELENVKEQRLVQDKYTSLFVTAFAGTEGIWVTRQALNLNVTPDWWRIGNAPNAGVKSFEFSPDGNTLWVGGWDGSLRRITGFDNCYSAEDALNNLTTTSLIVAGPAITSIAVDPNNINRVVLTFGGYGTNANGKVRLSTNAMSATPTWSNIWNFSGAEVDMEKMPVYSSIINVEDGNTIVVGTEFGVYASDDTGDTWTHCDNIGQWNERPVPTSVGKLNYVPVYDLRQQKYANERFIDTDNYGVIYAGTHGRGIFRSADFYNSVNEKPQVISETTLTIFPNPASSAAFVNVELAQSAKNVNVSVYDINGKLVRTINQSYLSAGTHKISLDSETLPAGNYIVTMNAGSKQGVGKFIKVN